MTPYLLRCEQTIPRPIDEVFAFFSRPENLARITPPSMNFVILTPLPISMRPGAVIDYTVRSLGLTFRWTTLIAEFEPPSRFVDVQLRGPYSFWHHTHSFEPVPGGTRMVDEVRYAMPYGPLGRLVHSLVIRRRLDKIFTFRRDSLDRLFDTAGPQSPNRTRSGSVARR